MRRFSRLFLTGIFFPVLLYGAMLHIPEGPLPGGFAHVDEDLVFGAQNLYGHINGGAELFLEFGFDSLFVYYYRTGEEEIALELYRMESPLSALGIYLQKCGREQPLEGVATRNTHNPYQTLLLRDRYFIQINSFGGKAELQAAVIKLANDVIAALPVNRPADVLSWLPQQNRIAGSERLLRGKYALEPVYTFGPGDILQLDGKYVALVADYKNPQTAATWSELFIRYGTPAYARAVFKGLVENLDAYLTPLQTTDSVLVFKDYQQLYARVSLQGGDIHIRFHLTVIPVQ